MNTIRNKKIWIEITKKSLWPLFYFFLVTVGFLFYKQKLRVFVPAVWLNYIVTIFFFLFLIVICSLVHKVSNTLLSWYQAEIASKTKTPIDDKFIPLFRKLIKTFIWIVALIVFLNRLGVNINALIATLGVSSLAIALAAQDTIANIICGFLIMLDQPFVVGDEIKLPTGEKAKVLEIGVRRSKFYSAEENAIIIVPNLDLSKSKIVNYTYENYRKDKKFGA